MFACVGQTLAVWRKLRIAAWLWRRRDLNSRSGLECVIPKLSFGIEEQMLRIGRPVITSDRVAGAAVTITIILRLLASATLGRRKRRHLLARYQHCRLAAGHIDVIELAVLAGVVRQHV